MTAEEALLYLPQGDQELEEVYEARLFEMQQFLLRQVPLTRLFRSKIQGMLRIQEAYEALGGVSSAKFEIPSLREANSESLLEAVRTYQDNLSCLKTNVMRSTSFFHLEMLADALLDNMRRYARTLAIDGGETGKITQAEDEMEVLRVLKQLEAEGRATKACILELDADNHVRREANRLSLWLKMEKDDGAV